MITKYACALAGLLALAAVPAHAEDIYRTGPNGGTVNGTWTDNGTNASGSVTVTGPNGGSGSGTVKCAEGTYRAGCAHQWTYTDAAGDTWSGRGATGVGPYGYGHAGATSGPDGTLFIRRGGWR